jgi:hypothetical protein
VVRIRLAAIVVATAASLLTSCGGDEQPSAAPTTTTPSSSAKPSPSSPSPSGSPSVATSATTLDDSRRLAAQDGFPLLAPAHLPEGWEVVSAEYGVEGRGTWELDLTDAQGGDVGVRQARQGVPAAYVGDIGTYLGSGARPVGTIDVPPLGTWDRYEGVRHPRGFAVGNYRGTNVVLWADDATLLPVLASALRSG